jgi:hypothetical protein
MIEQSQVSFQRSGDAILVRLSGAWRLRGGMSTEATRDGSKLNVFVELRAPNYPRSRYTLTYDLQQDQLQGVYFQAVEQHNFNVYFVRMK